MSRINDWLLANDIRIARNPCVSPDFCLDWAALKATFEAGAEARAWPSLTTYEASRFALASGQVVLMEDGATGDCAWYVVGGQADLLADGVHLGGQRWAYPASWDNLLTIKNLVQSYSPDTTIFPSRAAIWRITPSAWAPALRPYTGQRSIGPCKRLSCR